MKTVDEFLRMHGQSVHCVDEKKMLEQAVFEMEKGLVSTSSVPMIPTFLSGVGKIEPNSKKLLIDAGGTNFRAGVGWFDDNHKAKIVDVSYSKMPGTTGRVTKDQFYSQIVSNIKHLLPQTGDIGFCFSYNVAMQSDLDGIVAAISKEVDAPEVAGTKVGQCTIEEILKIDSKPRRIAILNDTVATLLGGMVTNSQNFSSYIGFIFGTGSNVCYIENTKNLKKLQDTTGLPQKMLINTECGGFDKFEVGDFDKLVLNKTANPNVQIFEKMTSGKYLGDIIFETLLHFFDGKVNLPKFSLKDVSEFLSDQPNDLSNCFNNQTDRQNAKLLCEGVILRAAKMWAIFLAAVVSKVETTSDLPIAIVAEGTTFHKLHGFKQALETFLEQIVTKFDKKVKIVDGTDLNLVGTLAATTMLIN